MKIDNKIEYVFGRTARFAGGILFFSVLFMFKNGYWIFGILFLVSILFVVFSYSGVEIDTEKRELRQYTKIFGLFKAGKWESIDSYLGVTLIPFTRKESVASWSNNVNTIKEIDFRVFMVNKFKKPAFPIKCCTTPEQAQDSIDEFSIWLKLPVFTTRK